MRRERYAIPVAEITSIALLVPENTPWSVPREFAAYMAQANGVEWDVVLSYRVEWNSSIASYVVHFELKDD